MKRNCFHRPRDLVNTRNLFQIKSLKIEFWWKIIFYRLSVVIIILFFQALFIYYRSKTFFIVFHIFRIPSVVYLVCIKVIVKDTFWNGIIRLKQTYLQLHTLNFLEWFIEIDTFSYPLLLKVLEYLKTQAIN